MNVTVAGVRYKASDATAEALKNYTQAIQEALNNPELAQDVEQRMVDILEEQGITGGKIITGAVLDVIKTIMGNPVAFSDADLQDMAVYHKKVSALRVLLRTVGGGALVAAVLAFGLLASALVSYFGRSSAETFPSGFAQWLYALFGLAAGCVFIIFSVMTGVSLLKGRLTKRGRRLLRVTGCMGIVLAAAIVICGWIIVVKR